MKAVAFNHLQYNPNEVIFLMTDGFDGTEDIKMPQNPCSCLAAYRRSPDYQGNGDSEESEDGGPGLLGKTPSGTPPLSRIEQKILDKELPWQHILNQSAEYSAAFVQSAKDEESFWKAWNSVDPLSQEKADEIYKPPILRKRIIKSRAAYRDKTRTPPLQAKCRVFAVGCLDPDLYSLNRECATLTRQAEYVLLSFFTCGKNNMLLDGRSTWVLWSGDVNTPRLLSIYIFLWVIPAFI